VPEVIGLIQFSVFPSGDFHKETLPIWVHKISAKKTADTTEKSDYGWQDHGLTVHPVRGICKSQSSYLSSGEWK
jgi:hypothetical protein